jgi:hypothetical protein
MRQDRDGATWNDHHKTKTTRALSRAVFSRSCVRHIQIATYVGIGSAGDARSGAGNRLADLKQNIVLPITANAVE